MATRDGDPYVLNVQQWVNNTYKGKTGYSEIPENGKTGWTTIYALLHALQIELGITATADNFGNGTINAFNRDYPNGVEQQDDNDTTKKNIYGIIQGALLCKGYSIGASQPTCNFYGGTGDAIKSLKADAGLTDTTSTVTLNIMKALMSMDYFYSYDTSERTQNIINMQRYLNRNYEDYIGLCPCDGVYGRRTSKALIYAIQAEEKMPLSVANGNCGPSTKGCLPNIKNNGQYSGTNYLGGSYSSSDINSFKILANIALYFNGFGNGNISSDLNINSINSFQMKYAISVNGNIDYTTWLSLLVSCGDQNRSAIACDCMTILDELKAQTLYNNGYRYVGRYLANVPGGRDKELSKNEIKIAFNAGLRIFPIQQGTSNTVSFFTENNAKNEVKTAYEHAVALGIPNGTIIYFAVDCDPQDSDITNMIIPYFRIVNNEMKNKYRNVYKVGIYGTRNVCTRVSNAGYAVASFVSDMSTGYSGNLGFSIPNNWSFDQFATVTVGSGGGQIEIDKDGYSGKDNGFGTLNTQTIVDVTSNIEKIFDVAMEYTNNNVSESNKLVCQYLRKNGYNNLMWKKIAGDIDSNFCTQVENRYPDLDFTFYDTATNVLYDLPHFAATLNALLYVYSPGSSIDVDMLTDIYAGWGGDALSFTSDIKDSSTGNTLDWAKSNICQNDDTKFPFNDYMADIDAINIYNELEKGKQLPTVFMSYFINSLGTNFDAQKRTSVWMNSVGTNYLEEACDLIRQDGLKVFAEILAKTDDVSQEYIDTALTAFKSFVYSEYGNGR